MSKSPNNKILQIQKIGKRGDDEEDKYFQKVYLQIKINEIYQKKKKIHQKKFCQCLIKHTKILTGFKTILFLRQLIIN